VIEALSFITKRIELHPKRYIKLNLNMLGEKKWFTLDDFRWADFSTKSLNHPHHQEETGPQKNRTMKRIANHQATNRRKQGHWRKTDNMDKRHQQQDNTTTST
jgi:hypothetical protein